MSQEKFSLNLNDTKEISFYESCEEATQYVKNNQLMKASDVFLSH